MFKFSYYPLFTPYFQSINSGKNNERNYISDADLLTIPHFIRFITIEIDYDHPKAIEERGAKYRAFLQSLVESNAKITGSKLVLYTSITNHATFFDEIGQKLLTEFSFWCAYKFCIFFYSEFDLTSNFIASLLQLGQINRCSNVELSLQFTKNRQLPVETIGNWLNRNFDGTIAKNKQEGKEIVFLRIDYSSEIENVSEMIEHLKKVQILYLTNAYNIIGIRSIGVGLSLMGVNPTKMFDVFMICI